MELRSQSVVILLNRFHDCLVIGRDLLRLLQSVATIPEFYKLWEDILKDLYQVALIGWLHSCCALFHGDTAVFSD